MTELAQAPVTGQGGSDTSMQPSRRGIAHNAASHQKHRLGHLSELLNEELLHECWRDINKHAAYGVDRVSAEAYAQHLDENIRDLVDRLKRQTDRATLVRRHDIPKGEGRRRPLGIPMVCAQCTSCTERSGSTSRPCGEGPGGCRCAAQPARLA